MTKEFPFWAANSRTVHAWQKRYSRDGRWMGYRSLCGTSTIQDDPDWSWPVDQDYQGRTPLQIVSQSLSTRPVCQACRERVAK